MSGMLQIMSVSSTTPSNGNRSTPRRKLMYARLLRQDATTRKAARWLGAGGLTVLAVAIGWCWEAGRNEGFGAYYGIPSQLVNIDPRDAITAAALLLPLLAWAAGPAVMMAPLLHLPPGWRQGMVTAASFLLILITTAGVVWLFTGDSISFELIRLSPIPFVLCIIRLLLYGRPWRKPKLSAQPAGPVLWTNNRTASLLATTGALVAAMLLPGVAYGLARIDGRYEASSQTYYEVLAAPPKGAPAGNYIALLAGSDLVVHRLVATGHNQFRMSADTWIMPMTSDLHLTVLRTGKLPPVNEPFEP